MFKAGRIRRPKSLDLNAYLVLLYLKDWLMIISSYFNKLLLNRMQIKIQHINSGKHNFHIRLLVTYEWDQN